jgi:hypothetical protein
MIPPQYVKPFVKRNKTDSADAEAICEAAGRPSMRFVAVKSIHQQSVLALHRARDLLVRQRTKLIQALRGYLGEFGIVAPKGAWNVTRLEALLSDTDATLAPDLLKEVATVIIAQIRDFDERIDHLHDRLASRQRGQSAPCNDSWHRSRYSFSHFGFGQRRRAVFDPGDTSQRGLVLFLESSPPEGGSSSAGSAREATRRCDAC